VSGTLTTEYTYNGNGLRVGQTINGQGMTFTWDVAAALPQVLATSDGAAYVYGLGLLAQQQGGVWQYPLVDGLGSVRQWADAAGQVTYAARYAPFGALLWQQGTAPGPWGFAGEFQDPTGLLYLRARWYDPATGRFLTRDPFPGLAALPQAQHPYVYVGNNPALYVDPSGRFINILIGGVVGGAVGAGAYTLSVALSGRQFNARDMWVVAGTGAVAGGLIGSGVGILALIGAGAGSSGLGYLAANAWMGSQFCVKDFGIAVGVGAISGALTPVVGTTVPGVMALEASANVAQYWLMEYTSGRRPTPGGMAWSVATGATAGLTVGSYKRPQIPQIYDVRSPWLDQALLKDMLRDEIITTTFRETPRSFAASVVSNLSPEVIERFKQWFQLSY